MKNCCKTSKKDRKCVREDGKEFSLPRRFSKKKCIDGPINGFTMRSSCAPYNMCSNMKDKKKYVLNKNKNLNKTKKNKKIIKNKKFKNGKTKKNKHSKVVKYKFIGGGGIVRFKPDEIKNISHIKELKKAVENKIRKDNPGKNFRFLRIKLKKIKCGDKQFEIDGYFKSLFGKNKKKQIKLKKCGKDVQKYEVTYRRKIGLF